MDASFVAAWTPFLLGGFAWNLIVTLLAVSIGTLAGAGLGIIRFRGHRIGTPVCNAISKLFRNVPTLAFLFAAVFVLPQEFTIGQQTITFPLWLKAALGLSPSVIGFASESLLVARRNMEQGEYRAVLLIIPTWGNSVLITFIASSTASLVGVNELINRCNSLIAVTDSSLMIGIYLYAALIFTLGCLAWIAAIKRLQNSAFLQSLPEKWAARAASAR